jgi:hypothetical protein
MGTQFFNEKFAHWYDRYNPSHGLFHKARGTYRMPNFLTSTLEFLTQEDIQLSVYDKTLFATQTLSTLAKAAPNNNKSSWAVSFNNIEEFQKAYIDFFKFLKEDFKLPFNKIKDAQQAELIQISYRYLSQDILTFLDEFPLLNKGSKNILAEKFFSSYNPFHVDGYSLYNNEENFYFYRKPSYGFYDDEDTNKDKWENYQTDQNKLNEEVKKFENLFNYKPSRDFMEKMVSKIIENQFTKRGALMIIYLKEHHNYILTDNQTKKLLLNLEYFDARIGEMIVDTQIYNHTIVKYKNPEKALKVLGVSAEKYEKVYKDKLTIYLEKLKLENLFTSLDNEKEVLMTTSEKLNPVNQVNNTKEEQIETIEEIKPKKRNKI